ncbi:MAG TPA: hypothetical protein VFA98_02825, partial [Thermoanaerobaculia bacterium]|nr:hypothetical protein [Thermoanaerobaculia bacterium]
ELITAAGPEPSPEASPLWRAIKNLRDDPHLQDALAERLKRYEINLLRLQADAVRDLSAIFTDSESFRKEEEQGLRWVRS